MKLIAMVLVDPRRAVQEAIGQPGPAVVVLGALAITALLGAATLPRQLDLLFASLAPTGDLARDLHHAAMQAGLTRIIVADRLMPPPTLLVAALVLGLAAEPVLSLAEDRRRAVWTVVLLGLAPLMVQRIGELAVAYLSAVGSPPRPGDAVGVAQRFTTGPLLFWWTDSPPPWLVSVNQRINLVSLWGIVIWTVGLRELDGRRLASWHVALPATCLAVAALATWWLSPMVSGLLLGAP
ncbi:MAG: hypothetical protein A3K13_04835 [Gemmatimonadetes bacterium RIFCSPLOWO2_12_FULL_68_9]|nr:MAG: hypothetical protein A3K13_04835 [Gemmatimonadetes bacterium RIFCSPLOWO2_12_FULL_68_9]